MASPVPDNRTTWEKVLGVPRPPDPRSWVQRTTEDFWHDHQGKVVAAGVGGLVVAGEVVGYHNAKRYAAWEARAYGFHVAQPPSEMRRVQRPATIALHSMRRAYQAAYGLDPPKGRTAKQLADAVALATKPKRELQRIATFAGLPRASRRSKLEIVRALAPVAHTQKLRWAGVEARVQDSRARLGKDALAASTRGGSKISVATAARSTGTITSTALKIGTRAGGLGALSIAKFAVSEVLHKLPWGLRLVAANPVGRVAILGAVAYGAYKGYQMLRPAGPAKPATPGAYLDKGAAERAAEPAIAPSPMLRKPSSGRDYHDAWTVRRTNGTVYTAMRRDYSVRTA